MIIRQIVLGGEMPFTTQRLTKLADTASTFQSRILIRQGDNTYNGRSLLGLMALARERDLEVTLVVEGADECLAAERLAALLTGDEGAYGP